MSKKKKKVKYVTVKVTKDNITSGQRGESRFCPIALALNESTGQDWHVLTTVAFCDYLTLRPSRAVARFVRAFDGGKKVKPQTFRFREV